MQHWLIINGLENAFPKEFGCACARCTRTDRTANTSASLVTLDDAGNTIQHVLFDAGGGVADSLAHHELLRGSRARLDAIVQTHWHVDHTVELRRLITGWQRSQRRAGAPFNKVPLWCRAGSAAWLAVEQPFVMRTLVQPIITDEAHPAGTVLAPVAIGLNDVHITPITMQHSSADMGVPKGVDETPSHRPCCAGFAIQTAQRKTLLFWDMDATNDWVLDPNNAAAQFARDADLMLIDCNTWRAESTAQGASTGHASFQTVCKYAAALCPRRTVLMHLSGHEDAAGDGFGWTDAERQAHASRAWAARRLPGSVVVPYIGQMFDG